MGSAPLIGSRHSLPQHPDVDPVGAALEIPPDDLEAKGWSDVGEAPARLSRSGLKHLMKSISLLGGCIKEAPEFGARRR